MRKQSLIATGEPTAEDAELNEARFNQAKYVSDLVGMIIRAAFCAFAAIYLWNNRETTTPMLDGSVIRSTDYLAIVPVAAFTLFSLFLYIRSLELMNFAVRKFVAENQFRMSKSFGRVLSLALQILLAATMVSAVWSLATRIQ